MPTKIEIKELLKEALRALENVGMRDEYINYDYVAKVKRKIKEALDE